MALIPGTLPNDTCYGTPQDLLELFAQYLDVPAFALNSKVVFGTSSAGLTADVVWFDTTAPTNPILKITVSGGFTDYIKNYVTSAATVTIVGADSVLILDASDSGNTKKGLVSDIVPAAGSITPSQLSQPFTSGTSVSASGTSVDFTGIPSWVKRITLMFNGVSTTGASVVLVQIGDSGGIENTGYVSVGGAIQPGAANSASFSTGFGVVHDQQAIDTLSGIFFLARLGLNSWVALSSFAQGRLALSAGGKTLSSTLDRVRVTTVGGSETFDLGSINILFE